MTENQVYDEASEVSARDGDVFVKGPGEVDVCVTPEAAEQTAENLFDGAAQARGQRHLKTLSHRPF